MFYLKVLTGEPSIFTVCARVSSHVACLSRQLVFDLMSAQPDVTLHLASSVTSHLSPFVRSIGNNSGDVKFPKKKHFLPSPLFLKKKFSDFFRVLLVAMGGGI